MSVSRPLIYEDVRITDSKLTVIYRAEPGVITPELEAKIRAYWSDLIDQQMRRVLGIPARDDPGPWANYDPAREHPAPRRPKWGALIPDGNVT